MDGYVSMGDTPGAPPLWGGIVLETEVASRNWSEIDVNRDGFNDCCGWDRYATGLQVGEYTQLDRRLVILPNWVNTPNQAPSKRNVTPFASSEVRSFPSVAAIGSGRGSR